MIEIGILGAFAAALLSCIITKLSILYALVFGYFLFFTYGLWKKYSVGQMLKLSFSGILTVKNILVTFILIGTITAIWRAGGTIPYIVYYATKVCTPSGMVLITFLLCCFVSVLTGTSFGTAATVGVICMTMANSMGISPMYTGGAILAGVYFGDRCSPMSTSALLVSELTETNIFRNISNMVKTSFVPFLASCVFYFFTGIFCKAVQGSANIQAIFAQCFDLHPATLIPAAIIVVFSLFRLNVKITMSASIIAGMVVALLIQHVTLVQLLQIAVFGYHPENSMLAALLGGGGIVSMVKVFAIVCLSSCYAGIFKGTGFLDGLKEQIASISQKITKFGGILLISIFTGLIACNQTLTIMLTHQLCQDIEDDKESLASHLENTAVVIAPLIPWSIASAVPIESISAPSACILAACYLYLLPIWNLLCAIYQERHLTHTESP